MRCLFAIQVFGALLLFQSVVYQTCAGTPACVQADWHASLDRIGWSKCPKTNTYFKGLWRHEGTEGDKRVGRIEFGRCCEAEDPSYVNQPASCGIITWKST